MALPRVPSLRVICSTMMKTPTKRVIACPELAFERPRIRSPIFVHAENVLAVALP
jgi:hypothetical protein